MFEFCKKDIGTTLEQPWGSKGHYLNVLFFFSEKTTISVATCIYNQQFRGTILLLSRVMVFDLQGQIRIWSCKECEGVNNALWGLF